MYCCEAKGSQQRHLWLNMPGVRGVSGGESWGAVMALMFSLSGESGSEGGEKQASGGRFGEAM